MEELLGGDLPAAIVVVAGVAVILDRVFSFISRAKDRKALDSLTSGEKPVEFWLLAFHEVIQKGLHPIDEKQQEILNEIEAFYEEFRDFKARQKGQQQ